MSMESRLNRSQLNAMEAEIRVIALAITVISRSFCWTVLSLEMFSTLRVLCQND